MVEDSTWLECLRGLDTSIRYGEYMLWEVESATEGWIWNSVSTASAFFLYYVFAKGSVVSWINYCQGKVSRVCEVQRKAQCSGVFGMGKAGVNEESGTLMDLSVIYYMVIFLFCLVF